MRPATPSYPTPCHRAQYQMGDKYCGMSVALIEKHNDRYTKTDSEEQLKRLFGVEPKRFPKPSPTSRIRGLKKILVWSSDWNRTVEVRGTGRIVL